MADWWEYVPGVSTIGNLAQGDYGDAVGSLIPGWQLGQDAWNSGTMQNEILPALGLKSSPHERALLDRMNAAKQSYEAYRPEVAQGRMQAMRQTASMMNPYNDLMTQMYGAGSSPDMGQVLQNPMHPAQPEPPPGAFGPPPQGGRR